MNTNQLPPELVEKLGNIVLGETPRGNDFLLKDDELVLQQCAQIAVDYYMEKFCEFDFENDKLRSERDELLEVLRKTMDFLPIDREYQIDFYKQVNQLIQKYDGK